MQPDSVIVRYGEIFLKSDWVRREFTHRLGANIKAKLESLGIDHKIAFERHRLIVSTDRASDAARAISSVFGVKSASPAVQTLREDAAIEAAALEQYEPHAKGTFAVRVKRPKNWPRTSPEMERDLGAKIAQKYGSKVNLGLPDTKVGIEIGKDSARVYTETFQGVGGLPYGTQGQLAARLAGPRDLEAAYLMMRRGCAIQAFGRPEMAARLESFAPGPIPMHKGMGDAIGASGLGLVIGESAADMDLSLDRTLSVPVFRPLIAGISPPGFSFLSEGEK